MLSGLGVKRKAVAGVDVEKEAAKDDDGARKRVQCPRCQKKMKLPELRLHMAAHILKGQAASEPWAAGCCGWCGGNMGETGCAVGLQRGSKATIQVTHRVRLIVSSRSGCFVLSYPLDAVHFSINLA